MARRRLANQFDHSELSVLAAPGGGSGGGSDDGSDDDGQRRNGWCARSTLPPPSCFDLSALAPSLTSARARSLARCAPRSRCAPALATRRCSSLSVCLAMRALTTTHSLVGQSADQRSRRSARRPHPLANQAVRTNDQRLISCSIDAASITYVANRTSTYKTWAD